MKDNRIVFSFICFATGLFFISCHSDNQSDKNVHTDGKLAKPTSQQVAYQQKEKIAFVHFGMNTFTNREWGTGDEKPTQFNPSDFDAKQWAKTLSENGFGTLILTAKHHDGFCLWPSKYTDHDIANSPYKNGKGDIVKEVSEACKKYDLDFGIYLSPWDRHEESYGTPAYNKFYEHQLHELLTNYGPITEVWFDGAKGDSAKDMQYDFDTWWAMVHKLQPDALIFSDEGPDIRWIGNEHGFAGKTNWSTINHDSVTIGKAGQSDYLNSGERAAPDWVVGECDVSIRPGWFYHSKEDDQVKSVKKLTEIYFKSVGRNGTLLLNIPPDKTGQFNSTDVKRLYTFSDTLASIFDDNLAKSISDITASSHQKKHAASKSADGDWNSFWQASEKDNQPVLTLHFEKPVKFNVLMLQEYIPLGQRVASFNLQIKHNDDWKTIATETTIGYKRILPIHAVTTDSIRIRFTDTIKPPGINNIGLFFSENIPFKI